MLRSEFKNGANSHDDIIKVQIRKRFALPLMGFILPLPKLAGQFSDTIFPTTTDAHAFIKFDPDIRKRCLPDIRLFEFPLNPTAKHFGCYLE